MNANVFATVTFIVGVVFGIIMSTISYETSKVYKYGDEVRKLKQDCEKELPRNQYCTKILVQAE